MLFPLEYVELETDCLVRSGGRSEPFFTAPQAFSGRRRISVLDTKQHNEAAGDSEGEFYRFTQRLQLQIRPMVVEGTSIGLL